MGDIVPFAPGEHVVGPARCHACGHTWQALAPVGVIELECPKCKRMFGLREGAAIPEGEHAWTCACGSDLFYIHPYGARCRSCGKLHGDWGDT